MRLIIFDWDGTLLDSAAHIVASVQQAARQTGLVEVGYAEVRNVIGLGLKEALTRVFPGITRSEMSGFIDAYRQLFVTGQPMATALFPGVREVLDHLRDRGFLLAVATGKGRNGLNRELSITKLHHVFDVTRCADETLSKPHPLMLEEILEETMLSPAQALMVGDTEYDLEMAMNARIPSVGVSWGVHDVARLRAYKPMAIVDSLQDLTEFMDRQQVGH